MTIDVSAPAPLNDSNAGRGARPPFHDLEIEYDEQREPSGVLLLYAMAIPEVVIYKGAEREGFVLGVRVESVEQLEQLFEGTPEHQFPLLLEARKLLSRIESDATQPFSQVADVPSPGR